MMTFKELDEAAYLAFEQQHPQGSYTQIPEQKKVLDQRSWTSAYVGVVDENDHILAAGLLNWRKLHLGYLFEVAGGPMMDYNDAALVKTMTDGIVAFAKARHGLVLRWLPNVVHREFGDDGTVLATENEQAITNLTTAGFTRIPFTPGFSTLAVGYQFVKKLTGLTPDTLVKSYQKDAQYALKKTQQFGITLRELSYDDLPRFKEFTQATADRLNFHDKPLDYYQKTYKAFGKHVKFIFAELNFKTYMASQRDQADKLQGEVDKLDAQLVEKPHNKHLKGQRRELADQIQQHEKRIKEAQQFEQADGSTTVLSGAMFFVQPQEVAYMFSFTNEAFKKFYAPYMIQDHMMRVAVDNGCRLYNFYGVSGVFDGSDGVLKFKQSFNGVTQEMLGTFVKPIRPVQYRLYELLKRVLGRGVDD
ncbi:aminoacyltransferase [Furfurilactobacillus entadae]|uniref:aminoacyltransferase n=1 Tax=Furfurilactobacillus entadae TaxID=2922307 RepID=UPI0035EF7AF5